MFKPLHELTVAALRDLEASLMEGALSYGMNTHTVQQIVGADMAKEVVPCLEALLCEGWSPKQIGKAISAMIEARELAANPEHLFDLVLSGPEVKGVPTRDTLAVMHALIESAAEEVIMVGYAVHNGKKIFAPLAQKMEQNPLLKVWLCMNIPRKLGDTSLDTQIVSRYTHQFLAKHWPWQKKPELYYDPRSITQVNHEMVSLHAKCVVVDRHTALITSANFTEAAQMRNIEAGVVICYAPFVQRIAEYFEGLRHTLFKPCDFSGGASR